MAVQIWGVGAGKGGVGKTFITSSLGVTLSKLNHRVLLVDFDMSGANLHTTFGLNPTEKNLRKYFEKSCTLGDLITPTEVPRVSIIQGFWDLWQPASVSVAQTRRLLDECRKLPFDFVLFDLGSGPSLPHLEVLSQTDEKIIVTNSEPTCVEKNYRLIESFICHSLQEKSNVESFEKLQNSLCEYRNSHKHGHFSFRQYLKATHGFEFDFFEDLQKKPLRLIVNCSRSHLDQDLGFSVKSVCNKYYDLAIDYVGSIDFDNAVWQSVKSREPVLIEKPFTPLAGQFFTICKQLTNSNFNANVFRAVV